MAYKATTDLFEPMLAQAKSALDGGTLVLFSGPVPTSPGDPLDMDSLHTQLVVMTNGNDGISGLTFDPPVGDTLSKSEEEVWEGTVSFNGADDSETTLTPTFFRFVTAGDEPTDAATGPRVQGTVGGPSSSADLRLGAPTLTDNGSNTAGVSIFTLRLANLG